ncbi:50S ribosomal protein L33 [Saccharomonospora sp. NPDC046836]
MARNDVRPISKLRRNDPDSLVLREYDPLARRHVEFREER